MSYEDYRNRVIDAQKQWNDERDSIYKMQDGYNTKFAEGMQPPHIIGPDNYDHLTLEQMTGAVSAMKPKLVEDAYRAWLSIGMQLAVAVSNFNVEFERTISGANDRGGWTGAAASAAVDAVKGYHEKSVPLAQAASAISLKLQEMRTGLEETQLLMPGVADAVNVTGKTLPKGGVMKLDDHNRTEAEEEGRRILRTVYAQVAGQTDVGVPYMPAAPEIVDAPGGPPVPPVPGGTPGPAGTGGPAEPGGSDSDGQQGPSGQTGQPNDPEGSNDDGQDGGQGRPGTQPAATAPAATDPASAAQQAAAQATQSGSPSATTPAGVGPTSGGPGAVMPGTGGGAGGSGGGSRGSTGGSAGTGGTGGPGAAAGAPGRSGPGGQMPGAVPAAASAGSGAGVAKPGAAGMPGMGMPGAARPGGDDEKEKGTPDYLVTEEHGDEVTGLDSLEKLAPPVIGGDYDRAPR
ncbi:hypothetical protein [Nocardia sp. BMG51109]|uniref:hypothetical protein n=1 Tax=Nocardia sp. BMG51109 TaxID=1056816 RepID=UPI0004B5D695|nr:hypothetical protein [Nocardia sp. BMG51109]